MTCILTWLLRNSIVFNPVAVSLDKFAQPDPTKTHALIYIQMTLKQTTGKIMGGMVIYQLKKTNYTLMMCISGILTKKNGYDKFIHE